MLTGASMMESIIKVAPYTSQLRAQNMLDSQVQTTREQLTKTISGHPNLISQVLIFRIISKRQLKKLKNC